MAARTEEKKHKAPPVTNAANRRGHLKVIVDRLARAGAYSAEEVARNKAAIVARIREYGGEIT